MSAEMNNPYIILKENIHRQDYEEINQLRRLCTEADKVALKLELDYKLNRSEAVEEQKGDINEFMYYDRDRLLGYIGICNFGGAQLEVNGMVHPEYRRRGIFRRLFSLVKDEWARRGQPGMLLLCDADAGAGQAFIKTVGTVYDHSEFEMYLRGSMAGVAEDRVILRKADNSDSGEITRQNSIYFGDDPEKVSAIMPEEEEKCGIHIYMAEIDGKAIGKVHLDVYGDIYGIYGLGVMPEYRRVGYGREILTKAVRLLKGLGSREIMLQVEATNKNALELYRSCGFVETSVMDYYRLNP